MNFNIQIRRVTIHVLLPYHAIWCRRPAPGEPDKCGPGCSVGTGEFLVDLDTGETKGRMLHDIAQVDEQFWKKLCARVGEEVRARLKDHVVFEPAKRIVLDLVPGLGQFS